MSGIVADMSIMAILKELRVSNFLKMYELGIITFDDMKKSIHDIYEIGFPDVKKEGLDERND